MKKLLVVILSISLFIPVSAQGVEFGQDATGDPNAVWVMGASGFLYSCLLYTSPSPRDRTRSRMPSSA